MKFLTSGSQNKVRGPRRDRKSLRDMRLHAHIDPDRYEFLTDGMRKRPLAVDVLLDSLTRPTPVGREMHHDQPIPRCRHVLSLCQVFQPWHLVFGANDRWRDHQHKCREEEAKSAHRGDPLEKRRTASARGFDAPSSYRPVAVFSRGDYSDWDGFVAGSLQPPPATGRRRRDGVIPADRHGDTLDFPKRKKTPKRMPRVTYVLRMELPENCRFALICTISSLDTTD